MNEDPSNGQQDLIVLVADKNMEFSGRGLMSRPEAFGIRPLSYDVFVHPERDPGCLLRGHDFLRTFVSRYTRAIVMLDRHGCGQEQLPREVLEEQMERRLSQSGWGERAAAIVLDPELEAWVWSDSPHVERVLGWVDRQPDLRTWLAQQGWLAEHYVKPRQPKEAVEAVLRLTHTARSSALYRQLALRVSFTHCTDPAFLKFKATLQRWFLAGPPR